MQAPVRTSSVDFLFAPTVQQVLGSTLVHPDRSFTLQELIRRADSGRGSAQQQIDRLVHANVLVGDPRRGRQRSIRANTEFFLYPELRSIALKTFGLVEPIREALQVYADRIDVMVVGRVPQPDLFELASRLQQVLGRAVQCNLYEPDERRDLVKNDAVVSQTVNGPRLQVLPHARTSRIREQSFDTCQAVGAPCRPSPRLPARAPPGRF